MKHVIYATTSNFTAYFVVYHTQVSALEVTMTLEITTDNPGGGQTFSSIEVTMNNLTNILQSK